jgi:predicted TIM-barrel fold metal-dependent hydrolase
MHASTRSNASLGFAGVVALLLAPNLMAQGAGQPILDMHLHVRRAGYMGPNPPPMCVPFAVMPRWNNAKSAEEGLEFNVTPCESPIAAATSDAQLLRETLEAMRRYRIIGMVSGEPDQVAAWKAAAPERIIAGLDLRIGVDSGHPHVTPRTPAQVRTLHASGQVEVLGEVMAQYEGISADDPRLEPYWALAEELDIPVGIHLGTGGPADPYFGDANFRARNSSPLRMEEVLIRHPRLRVYLMHAGYPFIDDLRALLFTYPQVYVDIGSIVYTEPRPAFYRFLETIVESGYGDRVMFGSDQMIWPGIIGPAVEAIQSAPFLTASQKRDIFYNNAARFLRLTPEQIARHHGL